MLLGLAGIGFLGSCGVAGLLAWHLFFDIEDCHYQKRVARLEGKLRQGAVIECIQGWLGPDSFKKLPTPNDSSVTQDLSTVPACIRDLEPFRILPAGRDGVSLQWQQCYLHGLDVYPAGKRPPITPKDNSHAYRATYGTDAIIWIEFR